MAVRRFDSGTLRIDAKRTPQGYLRADATIARIGVQSYRQSDGTQRRELRLPEEVFAADVLASFSLAPLTLEHPPEPLTPENTSKYQVGSIGEAVKQDGTMVSTTVLVTDAKAIAEVEGGKQQLSGGYFCDLEMTPGEWEGQRYDAIQRSIRGNHVAIVANGRAGPDVRMKLDSTDAVQVDDPAPSPTAGKEKPMALKTIKIDGVECEVSDVAAQLLTKQTTDRAEADAKAKAETKARIDGLAGELAAAKTEAEKQKARADAEAEAKTKAEKARTDAEDPARLQKRIGERVALEKAAGKLVPDIKVDGLDDAAVRKAVVAKLNPELKLDDKSPEYITARFDLALEGHKGTQGQGQGKRLDTGTDLGAAGSGNVSEGDAREAMRKANREQATAWRK